MDKFPEAFRRFEKVVDVGTIDNLRELEISFGSWAGFKWGPTRRQAMALAIEAQKIGIPTRTVRPTKYAPRKQATRYRIEKVIIKGKQRTVYRNVKTGRFVKKPQK